MDTIFDLINHKNTTYSASNTANGFTIRAALSFKESELYDQQRVLYVSDQTFADMSKPGIIALKKQTITLVVLSITTEAGALYPHTSISISSNILQNRKG